MKKAVIIPIHWGRRTMDKPDNYAAFYALLNRMHTDDKEELKRTIVMEYTFGRTDSLREMTMSEYLSAVNGMQKLRGQIHEVRLPARGWGQQLKPMRSAVLHQMQLMGINTADWARVNAYCQDNRIAGKPFGELSPTELHDLLKKLRAIQRKS